MLRAIFEELTRQQCVELLSCVPIGRLAVSVGALPAVFPVNHAVDGDDIVFRTSLGTKFSAATSGTVVAFEVDDYDAETREGWSVLVQGLAEEVIEADELERLRALPLESWGLGEVVERLVRVTSTVVTGRRIRRVIV